MTTFTAGDVCATGKSFDDSGNCITTGTTQEETIPEEKTPEETTPEETTEEKTNEETNEETNTGGSNTGKNDGNTTTIVIDGELLVSGIKFYMIFNYLSFE